MVPVVRDRHDLRALADQPNCAPAIVERSAGAAGAKFVGGMFTASRRRVGEFARPMRQSTAFTRFTSGAITVCARISAQPLARISRRNASAEGVGLRCALQQNIGGAVGDLRRTRTAVGGDLCNCLRELFHDLTFWPVAFPSDSG